MEQFAGPLAEALKAAMAQLHQAGASGVVVVAFTDNFEKVTMTRTVTEEIAAPALRSLIEQMQPLRKRILLPS